jgi:hypothetical protein
MEDLQTKLEGYRTFTELESITGVPKVKTTSRVFTTNTHKKPTSRVFFSSEQARFLHIEPTSSPPTQPIPSLVTTGHHHTTTYTLQVYLAGSFSGAFVAVVWIGLGAEFIANMVSLMYPAYRSFKVTLTTHKPSICSIAIAQARSERRSEEIRTLARCVRSALVLCQTLLQTWCL